MNCGCNNPPSLVRTGAPSLPGGAPALSPQHRHDCISSVMHEHGYTTRQVLDWLIAKCASPSPAGSDTQVQFNDGGALAGDAGLTWDKTNKTLTITSTASVVDLLRVNTSTANPIFLIQESGSAHARIGLGDTNESDNAIFFLLNNAGLVFSAPSFSADFGDPDGFGNSTLFKVDDANQAVTSNVKIVVTGDVIVDDSSKGMVLKSPNGHYWRGTIDNAGALSWADLGTSLP